MFRFSPSNSLESDCFVSVQLTWTKLELGGLVPSSVQSGMAGFLDTGVELEAGEPTAKQAITSLGDGETLAEILSAQLKRYRTG